MLATNLSAAGLTDLLPAAISSMTGRGAGPIGVLPVLADAIVAPALILILCVVAGLGTIMLLPGRKDAPVRAMGAVVVLAVAVIVGAILVRYTAAHGGGVHVYFWIFSFIALAGAVRVITHPRPVYSALYFVLTVFASAGLFVLLWAEFMAAALVLIYAGAILITYVFVIMLASQASSPGTGAAGEAGGGAGASPRGLAAVTEYDAVSREPVVAAAVGFALMGMLLFVIFDRGTAITKRPEPAPSVPAVAKMGGTQQLGLHLFQEQLVNLELAGLILTIGMVGAIIIARRRVLTAEQGGPESTETMVGPATPVDDNPHSIPVYGTDNPRQKAYPET